MEWVQQLKIGISIFLCRPLEQRQKLFLIINLCQFKNTAQRKAGYHFFFFFYIPFFIWSFQYLKLLINFNTCICLKSIVIVLHLFCVTNALVKRFVLCVLTSSASFQSAKTQTWIIMCNDVCHLGTAHYFFDTFWMPCSETDISFSFYACRRVYFTGTNIYSS